MAELIDALLRGKPIEQDTIEQIASDAVSSVVGRRVTIDELKQQMNTGDINIDWESVRVRASDAYSRVSSRVRSASSRVTPEERQRREEERQRERVKNAQARARAGEVSKARRILGYTAKEPVTKEMVKQRQRELARKHHPDAGGSVQRMQDINWAVDILLGPG